MIKIKVLTDRASLNAPGKFAPQKTNTSVRAGREVWLRLLGLIMLDILPIIGVALRFKMLASGA